MMVEDLAGTAQVVVGGLIGLALIYPAVWVMNRFEIGGPYAHGNIRPKQPFLLADHTPIKDRVRVRKVSRTRALRAAAKRMKARGDDRTVVQDIRQRNAGSEGTEA